MRRQTAARGPETVVVTGASAGVGRAVAHAFARRGHRVGLIARGRRGLDETAAEVEALGGSSACVQADVADHDQVEVAARSIEDELGPIDVWVNNAMVTMLAPFQEVSA